MARKAKINSEDYFAEEVYRMLQRHELYRNLNAVYLHIPNEGKRSITYAAKLKRMGMKSGASDYVFAWAGGSGFLEIKVGKNKQTAAQKDFQKECDTKNVFYSLAYTVEEVEAALWKWGVLKKCFYWQPYGESVL